MASYTPNLALVKFSNADVVNLETALNTNWNTLDTIVSAMQHTDEYKTTTETNNNKSVRWFCRRYTDGRMEIESDGISYSIPIRTGWEGGWFRSNIFMQWVFPYSFTSFNNYECRAVQTSELCAEVPVLNHSGNGWVSSLTTTGWKTYLFYIAPDAKTATIVIRVRVTGKWK